MLFAISKRVEKSARRQDRRTHKDAGARELGPDVWLLAKPEKGRPNNSDHEAYLLKGEPQMRRQRQLDEPRQRLTLMCMRDRRARISGVTCMLSLVAMYVCHVHVVACGNVCMSRVCCCL